MAGGGKHGEVMWPRLVANKILKKRLGSNNFVADFPSNNYNNNNNNNSSSSSSSEEEAAAANLLQIPIFGQSSSLPNTFYHHPNHNHTNYKVFVCTWNVGGIAPNEDLGIMEDLVVDTSCDIYVFGFQEIVPLKASNVFGSENRKISSKWNSMIREGLKKKVMRKFKCIISKQMVGIMISIWVRSDLHQFIRNPSVCCIGCGIMGCLGNKGSVSVRFRIHETSFCFVCCHLASGGREGDEKFRNSNISEILCRTAFPKGAPTLHLPNKILHHQRVVLLGDLNYRISLPEATTRLLVERNDWNTLLENDQLRMEMKNGQILEGWEEGNIKFGPTYKYYPNSDVYYGAAVQDEKRRAPAWCDRIIWKGDGLKQVTYNRGESRLSDHRPVMSIFVAEVEVVSSLKSFQGFFLSSRFEHINENSTASLDDVDDDENNEVFSTVGFVCNDKLTLQNHFKLH